MRRVSSFGCALVLAACASQNGQKQAVSSPSGAVHGETSSVHGDAFAVVRIDDDVDPLASIDESALPEKSGMAPFQERTLAGGDKVVERRFVRVVIQPNESNVAACARFLDWSKSARIALPPDHRFACENVDSYDPGTHAATTEAVRTYVIAGPSILTQHDVVDAYVGDDKSDEGDLLDVAVKLSPEGRAKLKAATKEWTHRRLAVMSDGMVSSAPLVKGEIDTDTLTIGFGPRSPAELDRAQAFVSRLLGK